MKWIPPQKGTNPTNTDKMKSGKEKPRSGRSGASNKKNTGGIPTKNGNSSMTNNIRRAGYKQPSTIKEANEQRSELFHLRVNFNAQKKEAIKQRNKIDQEAKKVRRKRALKEVQLNAAKLLGNEVEVNRLQAEYDKLTTDVQKLGALRGGRTKVINNRTKLVNEIEELRASRLDIIEDIRASRASQRSTKRTNRKSAPQVRTQDSHVEDAVDIDPQGSYQQHPFPATTTVGGDILIDDTQVSERTYTNVGLGTGHRDPAYRAALIAYNQVVEHEHNESRENIHVQNLADLFKNADEAGLSYEHQGVELPVSEAVTLGANIDSVWDHIKHNYDGGSNIEKIPYKGILDMA